MNEPTIVCPNCRTEVKLTESLAAPLLAATEARHREQLARERTGIAAREAAVQQLEAKVQQAQAQFEEQVRARLQVERAAIAEAEGKRARAQLGDQIARSQTELAELNRQLGEKNAKLAAAEQLELQLRRERQQLQEERERIQLETQRAIDAARATIRAEATQAADQAHALRLAERDKTIDGLQQQLKEALRKAEQGSQQLQGEVQELQLEALLRAKFPRDTIEPVPKGEFGGDAIQTVFGNSDLVCGKILWESKRTRLWADGWLPKLREDMRAADANLAVLVTQTLPKGVETFDCIGEVWVTSFRCVVPLALALRQSLIQVAGARTLSLGQQTKQELLYQYLTGQRFRNRVHAIVERMAGMQAELDRERRALQKSWAKREEQIRGALEATVGMFGDFQGIAGKSLPEIEGLSLEQLGEG